MNDEYIASQPEEESDDPDAHYARLSRLVSLLLEDGRLAMTNAWDCGQTYWPTRPLDTLIRTAELKTFSAATKH
jgi:hypothetical protein